MKVYPVPGGRVRDPHTRAIIPADGHEVPENDFYWLTRIAHGDVTTEPSEGAALPETSPQEDAPAPPAPEFQG